jgi:chromate reductase, NAD(P)H dehydrogenase (quinone)
MRGYMWKWMLVLCVAFSATLNAEVQVLAFAGSTREDSVNKKLVAEAAQIARQMQAKEACKNNLNDLSEREAADGVVCYEVVVNTTSEEQNASDAPRSRSNRSSYSCMLPKVTVVDLKDYPIPFYDEDLETKEGMPIKAKQLRRLMVQSDVILIASPEYNASLSAVLKNAIDWASRSETGGGSREAFAGKKFVIMSASPGSGGGARGLMHLRAILENVGGTVLPQQVTVPDAYNAFDAQGHLKNEKVKKELEQLVRTAITPN